MFRTLAGAGVAALMLSTAAFANHEPGHDEDSVTLYRVFVGDHDKGQITAFDLSKPENRWSFSTTGQSKLYPVAGGAVIAAIQFQNETVQFIRSGVEFQDHGDHQDIEITQPAAIETPLNGPRPFHLVAHDGKVGINFDKGGYVAFLDNQALKDGKVEPVKFTQERAHHGFATPFGKVFLSTVASTEPVEGDAAPKRVGLQAFNADGTPAGDLATCTAIHGEAFSGNYLAVGCKEGVLTAKSGDKGPEYKMIPYPADAAKDLDTGTILGSTGIQVFLGNFGKKAVAIIDPADEPHFRVVDLPFRRVDFALDPVKPSNAYVLTEDGTLHRIDLLKGAIAASAKVTEPYSMDGEWNDPRPRLAMAGNEIVMSDPNAGVVRRISTEDLKETGIVAVEGKPYNIAVAGGSGVVHAGGEHDHDHDHKEGHDHK